MKIIYDCEQDVKDDVALTFGNFDGVHLGHGFAISTVKKIAQERGLASAVLTFEPHPSTILLSRKNFRLVDQEQKKELISRYDIDYLYIISFNEDFSQISCEDFISKILVSRYNAKHIVVGENCTFGHKRLGDILTLERYSEACGYSLTKLKPLIADGEICSSSVIREHLQKGEMGIANKLLSRPYQVSGIVTKGACRGRELGFPTINIPIEDSMIKPKFGTYYAKVVLTSPLGNTEQNWLYGVVNIGMRPTFKDLKKPIVEMYIFDFNEDVYNYRADIQLLKFMRSEKKFHSINELTSQINYDILSVRNLRIDL
ncbi:riboflavin biosynthesis protein RibF [Wolbachia endosymbiont of Ctenocephalides felis wCfeT]|uniref:riboflavin biosynthesis protein RibF n=1 Tax=Wolbachia endosymbiont of Ctenocephalides felis wCfeT TaxID=2732593 RepID=UPI0014456F4F|nr:riboflavin biosynthesis protein RibF [Wolbachia endosymbiont of Ctenocephalides felis wCfeT]